MRALGVVYFAIVERIRFLARYRKRRLNQSYRKSLSGSPRLLLVHSSQTPACNQGPASIRGPACISTSVLQQTDGRQVEATCKPR